MRFITPVFILLSLISIAHAHDELNTIEITENGFFPKTITIDQGETLLFKNTDTKEHWPASDLHPTHSIYPNSNINNCGKDDIFDACKGIEPGKSWSFTFDHSGTWRCHDHLYPKLICTIVVKEDPNFDLSIDQKDKEITPLSKIKKIKIDFATKLYKTMPSMPTALALNPISISKNDAALLYWLSLMRPEEAMQSLLDATGNGDWQDCHQEAHQIGRISYQLFGASVFEKGDASCHSGFYHGAMERLLTEEGFDDLSKKMGSICRDFATDFGKYQCFHGIGHGILAVENYELPHALDQCGLFNGSIEQGACYGGAFMENVIAAQGYGASKDHETKWVSNDPHFPCNVMNESLVVQERCYQMQTSWMLTLFKHDFEKVIDECKKAPVAMQGTCFQSFGRDAAGETLRNPKKMKELCYKIEGIHREDCVMGAVNVIIDFWGSKLDKQASEFCSLLEAKEKEICYQILVLRLAEIFENRDDWKRMCGGFGDYQYLCDELKV